MKKILTICFLTLTVAACQTQPKTAPKCKGEFTSLNSDFTLNEKKEKRERLDSAKETSSGEKTAQIQKETKAIK